MAHIMNKSREINVLWLSHYSHFDWEKVVSLLRSGERLILNIKCMQPTALSGNDDIIAAVNASTGSTANAVNIMSTNSIIRIEGTE